MTTTLSNRKYNTYSVSKESPCKTKTHNSKLFNYKEGMFTLSENIDFSKGSQK